MGSPAVDWGTSWPLQGCRLMPGLSLHFMSIQPRSLFPELGISMGGCRELGVGS